MKPSEMVSNQATRMTDIVMRIIRAETGIDEGSGKHFKIREEIKKKVKLEMANFSLDFIATMHQNKGE